MSVLCQNFVQNAWKKDLCSNCFKSVGDHQTIHGTHDSSECHEFQNGLSTTLSNSSEPVKNDTPHTTWRSLISEKNGKNTQPFKLENGFQGRLLTINKALNGNDHKPNSNEVNRKANISPKPMTNGTYSKKDKDSLKIQPTLNETSVIALNSVLKKQIAEKSESIQHKQNGTAKYEDNVKRESSSDDFKLVNRQKYGESTSKKQICIKEICQDGKLTESKVIQSESLVPESKHLHGILKKTKSISVVSNNRRSSNVGFKEEEPLVIGYGGRDFSPEELEWEMASDGDAEGTSDSLDESEDDQVFSKMTKQNTEFNSETTNLSQTETLQKERAISENKNNQYKLNVRSELDKINSEDESKKESLKMQVKTMNVRQKNKVCQNKCNTNERNEQNKKSNNNQKLEKNIELAEKCEIAGTLDINNASFQAKCEETTYLEKKNSTLLIQNEESGVNSKNSSKIKTEPAHKSFSPEGTKSIENGKEAMFSDVALTGHEKNASEENDWQEGQEISDEILQAINTSITNRHKINQNPDLSTEENFENINKSNEKNIESNLSTTSVFVSDEIEKSKDTIKDNLEKEGIANVEPRKSFLHGVSTEPSAIYGPASDLFVTRSDSSSSSSSDELGKSRVSLSVNVIVQPEESSQISNDVKNYKEGNNNASIKVPNKAPRVSIEYKEKPKIPIKPTKSPSVPNNELQLKQDKAKCEIISSTTAKTCDQTTNETTYYSTIPEDLESHSNFDGPYAESNIYHEVNDRDIDNTKRSEAPMKGPGIESKLAALAIELEQVRNTNSNNTKRQAPAPPKIPDPPQEDPPSCTGRTTPPSDVPQNFSTFKGESMGFSSASSTTSTSSQDTEAGYASWNLHGDSDDIPKHKFKSSFLLAQYSKCKMLAMGVAEDSARARKRFSIKKLLKLGKETEAPVPIDPNSPNPKAWKYSDNFERPRAKLEIIHPMDLENKSVSVNPGFESMHSGSMTSFSPNLDETSLKQSASSDYGSFYSDTLSPHEDSKQEVNYEYIQPRLLGRDEQEESSVKTSSSTSPTPSRSSTASQTSTVTSGSSKNGATNRPPKPPPPPRAHSLLPGNKIVRNVDGTFRFPVNGDTSSSDEVTTAPTKPQAPRRQCKSAVVKPEALIADQQYEAQSLQTHKEETLESIIQNENQESCYVRKGSTIQIGPADNHSSHNRKDPLSSSSPSVAEARCENLSESEPKIQTSITITTNNLSHMEKEQKSALSRNKHQPLTKSPARTPPIYSKPQSGIYPKNHHPWKTLEDSYLALTTCNRELLIKLINQALKKKKNSISKLNKCQFQWSDFEIDTSQQSSIFAFGEKIAYHATMPDYLEFGFTLVITVHHNGRLQENNEMKYPVFGKFTDCIPSDLLDSADENELDSIPATVLVMDRSEIATIESFSESLPEDLSEENEKELCFIILQLIQSLKTLQVQGIESIDSNFQNLLLAKTKNDRYYSLIFLSDNCYDERDYATECTKISLCQYTLMLLYQMLKMRTIEDDNSIKYSSVMSKKVFETAFSLLSEEKAVSLSQTKTLFECYLWGVTKVLESFQSLEDCDSVLHRWLDIERSAFIKNMIFDEEYSELNVQNDYYSQFLIRTNARNIKEIAFYL